MCSSRNQNINLTTFSVSSSSSSFSSTSSSSHSQAQKVSQITMEEVWKEINLGSIHNHRKLNIDDEPMFQDFLNQKQPPPLSSSSSALYGSPLPLPTTLLSLNPNSINTKESARFGCLGKKRSQDDQNKGERRHKRMIKNRESAARSRARKQESAYTNELELEIANLQKENARLMRQDEQLKMVEASQNQIKKTLQRSSTAPF